MVEIIIKSFDPYIIEYNLDIKTVDNEVKIILPKLIINFNPFNNLLILDELISLNYKFEINFPQTFIISAETEVPIEMIISFLKDRKEHFVELYNIYAKDEEILNVIGKQIFYDNLNNL